MSIQNIGITIAICIFMVVNIATASRSPPVWCDEVMFAEPAGNVLNGHGLVSRAWPVQTSEEIWAGNAPLHTWLLIPWTACLGLTVTTVRSLNYCYVAIAAMLVLFAMSRHRLLTDPRYRILLLTTLLLQNSIAFSYRSGRYDAIGMMLAACVLACSALRNRILRLLTIFLLGCVFPFAGLQLLPAAFAISVVLMVFDRQTLKYTIPLGFGCAVGLLGLYLTFELQGVWDGFVSTVRAFRATNTFLSRLVQLPRTVFFGDPTLVFLVFAYIAILMDGDSLRWKIAAMVLAVPAVLCAAGHFPRYYLWMASAPLTIWIAIYSEQFTVSWRIRRARFLVVCLVATMLGGLPSRLLVVAVEWDARDYSPLSTLLESRVSSSDSVVSDWPGFYPLHKVGATSYYISYIPLMTEGEKRQVTMLFVRPETKQAIVLLVGGEWEVIDKVSAPVHMMMWDTTLYNDLTLYKRVRLPHGAN